MALSNIASLSSLYVPLSNPPLASALPGYLRVDRTSEWHTSALLSAAIETSTLPTRLHDGAGRLGRMDDLAASLNLSGRQKIAMLSMSVSGPGESPPSGGSHGDDDRVPRAPRLAASRKAARIDCSWAQGRDRKEDHVFAEADVARGFDGQYPEEPERTGDRHEPIISRWGAPSWRITLCCCLRLCICKLVTASLLARHPAGFHPPRRCGLYLRFAVACASADTSPWRSVTSPLAFPLVDSFPSIFPATPATTAHGNAHTAVHTRLESSSAVIGRVRGVKEVVAFRVGVEEREALMNDLDEIVDGFQHGWMSDDEEDSDD